MKKTSKIFTLILAAMALIWSCSKDDGPNTTTDPNPDPVNAAPTISAQEFEAKENISDTDEIGMVTASDTDKGDVLTFSIAENELFEITEAGVLTLKAGMALDFEAKPNYEVNVTVTDSEDKTASATMKITVLDVLEADPADKGAFVTTWQTDADGETIYIGLNPDYNYDFTINWGDGTVEELTLEKPTHIAHVYETAEQYKVAIIGDFPAIQTVFDYNVDVDPAPKAGYGLIGIEQWGDIQWQTMEQAFRDTFTLQFYYATDTPDLSQVTNMYAMFASASVFNADLIDWDTSTVTDMSNLFQNASAFNGDISSWKTGAVTDMSRMFWYAEAFNRDLNNWNTGSVTDMTSMFQAAVAFNGDIGNWNTGSVTDMNSMFRFAKMFNGDLSKWNTESVTDMAIMFFGASAFNGNISQWNTEKVTSMASMLRDATAFDQNLGEWNIGAIDSENNSGGMINMFDNSGMSTENMTLTLEGWATFVEDNSGPLGVTLGLSGFEFCTPSDAKSAIEWLETNADWNVEDNVCF